MNVLVLGANGQLGRSLRHHLPQAQFWGRRELDLSRPENVKDALRAESPDCLINAAAYTAVDKAESEPELAQKINSDAVAAMADTARERGFPLVHFSTDYVFSGELGRAYREDDETGPGCVYGRTKLAGEEAIRQRCPDHWIFRTSWVFSPYGHNFLKSMLCLGRERDALSIVDDQVGKPTFAGDIAAVVAEVIRRWESRESLPWGTWHLADAGPVSWYDFAQAIFERADSLGLVHPAPRLSPISTSEYPTPARRPANSVLDTSRLESVLGLGFPDWRTGLDFCLELLRKAGDFKGKSH